MPDADSFSRLARNYESIVDRMSAAYRRGGRATDDVRLVAVTKSASVSAIQGLVGLGQRHLGEGRPQQLVERAGQVAGDVEWHLVGHLQRNKVARTVPAVGWIHSVDSERLLRSIAETGTDAALLLEVNVAGEAAKHGFAPDELVTLWPTLQRIEGANVRGLMAMAPFADEPELARPHFRRLRELRDSLRGNLRGEWSLDELSMGMSGDFEVAIEEGATWVRVGSRLFEGVE